MKRFFLLTTCFLTIGFLSVGQNKSKSAKANQAADYKIRQYWFVLLTTGPNTTADSATSAQLFEKHRANISRLYKQGVLKVAGPFGENTRHWRGLFVFDCPTKKDAELIVQSDAAIAAGLLAAEITPWYTAPIDSFEPGKPSE